MQRITSVEAMQQHARALQREGKRIGLVPTMGFLHEGHLSLIRRARHEADATVVSLFVNPKQFGPNEDYNRYPRDFARDEQACEAEGADVLFHPSADEMYAPGHSVYVEEVALSRLLEGEHRPGHFQGVLSVVAKLFLAVLPDIAVFGRKDAQQLCLIRKMVRDLNFPVRIIAAPTVREADGLAMSSRNAYLSGAAREQATCLYRALLEARRLYREGQRNADQLRKAMETVVLNAPEAEMDYADIVDADTFTPVTTAHDNALALIAVRFGSTRLIDNMPLQEEEMP